MNKFLLACSVVAMSAAAPANAASLIGDTITCQQTGVGSTFSCSPSSAVVGGGVEFQVGNASPFFALNFNGGGLRITNVTGSAFGLGATVVSLSNLTHAFTSATLLNSSITNFNSSKVSLQNGVLQLNFIGTDWASNSTANIQLETASAVPEPATWAMMLLGIGAVGGAMRSRRRQRVSVTYA